ncbi:MAG: PD-(D/E)XK nuclease family protein [Nanoarchaeota archaeon]|nr:PD-(D/E)XK nuclease family protein [Nanoarchaeota archaeon]
MDVSIQKDQILKLNINYLADVFKEWNATHYEKLTLLQIIQYGDFEPIHTKYLYWLLERKYHKKPYNFLFEFLQHIGINTNKIIKFNVNTEITVDSRRAQQNIQRRVDIWIELFYEDRKQNIIIENKIYDRLTPEQVDDEISQYLNHKGDMFIALLLDSNKLQFEQVITHPSIEKHKERGIELKLFKYSNWLQLNKSCITKKIFNKDDVGKVIHLNKNIKRLINMEEILNFDENYKMCINSYDAIIHIQEMFQEQAKNFLDRLHHRIQKENLCGEASNKKTTPFRQLLSFEYKDIMIEIIFDVKYLTNKSMIIYAGVPLNLIKNHNKLELIEGYAPWSESYKNKKWSRYEYSVDAYDIEDIEAKTISKLKKIMEIAKTNMK